MGTRRQFISGIAAASVVSIAGCSSSSDDRASSSAECEQEEQTAATEEQPPEQNTVSIYVEQGHEHTIIFEPHYVDEVDDPDHYIDTIRITDENGNTLEQHTDLFHPEKEDDDSVLPDFTGSSDDEHLRETTLEPPQFLAEETEDPLTLTVEYTYANCSTYSNSFALRHPRELLNTAVSVYNRDEMILIREPLQAQSYTERITIADDDGVELGTITPENHEVRFELQAMYADETGDGIYHQASELHITAHSEDGQYSKTRSLDPPLATGTIPSITHRGHSIDVSGTFERPDYYLYTPAGQYIEHPETGPFGDDLEHPDAGEQTEMFNLPPHYDLPVDLTQPDTPVYLLIEHGTDYYVVEKAEP